MKDLKERGWVPRKLDELGFVGRGRSRHRPRNAPELYDGPYPFVQTAEIMASEFYITSHSKTYTEVGLAQSKMWQPNTLCMTIAGENTAETAILAFPACFPDSVVGFNANPDEADVRFVKYFLDTIKQQIKKVTKGATQDNLSLDKLLSFDILTPPVKEQAKIASLLTAYDELILNNTRRIAVLEEMAQELYREWFVRFRFPGHENVPLVSSPLGDIPQGWKPTRLGDLATECRRGVSPADIDKETPYFGLEHLPRKSITLCDWGRAGDVHSTKLRFEKGEILFGKIRPYFHKVGVAPLDGVASSDAIVIVPKNSKYFASVLCCVSSDDFISHATQTSQGTKMPRANWEVLVKYGLPLPPEPILGQFNELINNIVATLQNLLFKNLNLRQTRDLLLPKLISGQLDVEHLDIDVGEPVTV